MTTTTYAPKHKKPAAYGGSTPRGPQRWARAADNALRNPRSGGAKLYQDRVANARAISDDFEDRLVGPIVFMDDGKRKDVACGLFCAVMNAQLVWSTQSRAELRQLVTDGRFERVRVWRNPTTGSDVEYRVYETLSMTRLDVADLKASRACCVCGTTVRKGAKR